MNINQLYSKYCKVQKEAPLKKEASAKKVLQALVNKTKNVGNIAKDKAVNFGKSVKDTAVDAGETLTDFAVRNPKTTVSAALAALLSNLKD